jgi:hypothetical protein
VLDNATIGANMRYVLLEIGDGPDAAMKIYHLVSSPPKPQHSQRLFKGFSSFVEGITVKSDAEEIKDAILREYSPDRVVPDHNR